MHSGASVVGLLLKIALESAFKTCDISGAKGNAHTLLYGNAISCHDNQNSGVARVREILSEMARRTFYGDILFNAVHENYAGDAITLQVSGWVRG